MFKKILILWIRKKKKRKQCETDFIIIPRGEVSQLQVLDMVVNQSFDNHLKIICRMKGFVISTWILWFFTIRKNKVLNPGQVQGCLQREWCLYSTSPLFSLILHISNRTLVLCPYLCTHHFLLNLPCILKHSEEKTTCCGKY